MRYSVHQTSDNKVKDFWCILKDKIARVGALQIINDLEGSKVQKTTRVNLLTHNSYSAKWPQENHALLHRKMERLFGRCTIEREFDLRHLPNNTTWIPLRNHKEIVENSTMKSARDFAFHPKAPCSNRQERSELDHSPCSNYYYIATVFHRILFVFTLSFHRLCL